jgi:hypothetical protein
MCNAVGFCVRYRLRRTRSLLLADLFDLRHAKHILHPRPAQPTWLVPRPLLTAARQEAYHGPRKALAAAVAWCLCSGLLLLCNTVLCSPLPTSRVLECEQILPLHPSQPLIDAPLHPLRTHTVFLYHVCLHENFPPWLAPRARAPYEPALFQLTLSFNVSCSMTVRDDNATLSICSLTPPTRLHRPPPHPRLARVVRRK